MEDIDYIPEPILEMVANIFVEPHISEVDMYLNEYDISISLKNGIAEFTKTMEWTKTITVDKILKRKP